MMEYTALDVIFLPKVYSLMKENLQSGLFKETNFDKVSKECEKSLNYCKINLAIKNFNKINIERDKVVEGLIK
jgi:hypothetical protein